MDPSSGRFWTVDSYGGSLPDPTSLHKYLFANGDGVNRIDPSGLFTVSEALHTVGIHGILNTMATLGIKGAVTGGIIGGARATIAGEDVGSGVINGAIIGGILGPITAIRLLQPILGVLGFGAGITSASREFGEGNYGLAAFDAGLGFLSLYSVLNSIGRISFSPPIGTSSEAAFEAEVDAAVARATSGSFFKLPAQNPSTGDGLIDIKIKFDPTKPIAFHNNMEFQGIQGTPGNGKVEVRFHTENPKFPGTGGTTQINQNKYYLLPGGIWKKISVMTDAEREAAHIK